MTRRPPTNVRFEIVNGVCVRHCDDEGVFTNSTDIDRFLAVEARHRQERHQRRAQSAADVVPDDYYAEYADDDRNVWESP